MTLRSAIMGGVESNTPRVSASSSAERLVSRLKSLEARIQGRLDELLHGIVFLVIVFAGDEISAVE